jgi:hypothetical protein
MEEAERIAREEHGSGRIAVISGELFVAVFPGRKADQKVLVREITIEGSDTGWMDHTWSRICCMMTRSGKTLILGHRCSCIGIGVRYLSTCRVQSSVVQYEYIFA